MAAGVGAVALRQWGPLTGADSLDGYIATLTNAATSKAVPSVLIAVAEGELLGSATLVASDLPPRPELTPWLAQLFVKPTRRHAGVGAALVRAILDRARHAATYVSTSTRRVHSLNTIAGWDGESWSGYPISSASERS